MGGCLVTKSEEQFRISYSVFQHIAHSNKIIFFTIITGCRGWGGGIVICLLREGIFFEHNLVKQKAMSFFELLRKWTNNDYLWNKRVVTRTVGYHFKLCAKIAGSTKQFLEVWNNQKNLPPCAIKLWLKTQFLHLTINNRPLCVCGGGKQERLAKHKYVFCEENFVLFRTKNLFSYFIFFRFTPNLMTAKINLQKN